MATKQTLFTRPKTKYLADIINYRNPMEARGSVKELKSEFNSAKTNAKRLKISRATLQASNRAYAIINKKNLSTKEKREFREIGRIYKKASDEMFAKYKSKKK